MGQRRAEAGQLLEQTVPLVRRQFVGIRVRLRRRAAVTAGEVTQADAARKWAVDVSTIIGIRRTVKDAARVLDAVKATDHVAFDPRDIYTALPAGLVPKEPYASFAVDEDVSTGGRKPLAGEFKFRGRTVFVPEDPGTLSCSQLQRLWLLRNDEQLVIARTLASPRALDEQLLERVAQWGRGLQRQVPAVRGDGAIHMLRREAALQLLADGSGDDDCHRVTPLKAPAHARADAPHATARPRRAATFLRHLRRIALGE